MTKCKYKYGEYCAYIDQYCVEGPCPYEEPQTNADRIRAMTDEELAVFLAANQGVTAFDGSGKLYERWLDWLKQEAQAGERGDGVLT